jgi:hypothetical protein
VLWIISIHFYFPVLFILALFACMLAAAGIALLPTRASDC